MIVCVIPGVPATHTTLVLSAEVTMHGADAMFTLFLSDVELNPFPVRVTSVPPSIEPEVGNTLVTVSV